MRTHFLSFTYSNPVQLDVFVGVGAAYGRVEGAKSLIDELIVHHFFYDREYRTENTIVASLSH